MAKNRKFKAASDPLEDKLEEANDNYDHWMNFEAGETRTVDFQMLNGERENFSYAHYMKAWTGKEGGVTVIKVFFSADLVTIKGYCLNKIYHHLCKMDLKAVRANHERYYQAMTMDDEPFVIEIKVEKHKNGEMKTQ